jgi:hypothetical protein
MVLFDFDSDDKQTTPARDRQSSYCLAIDAAEIRNMASEPYPISHAVRILLVLYLRQFSGA